MIYLLDTQLLVWATVATHRLSVSAREVLVDAEVELAFSAVSIWEVAIKTSLGKADFDVDPGALLLHLRSVGYIELHVRPEHALPLVAMPLLHKDPFDRLILAQAMAEGMTLLTADHAIARYPGPVRLV